MNEQFQLHLSGWTALIMCIAILGSCVILYFLLKIIVYAYKGKKYFFKEAKEIFMPDIAEVEYKGYIKGLRDVLNDFIDSVYERDLIKNDEDKIGLIQSKIEGINLMEQVVELGRFALERSKTDNGIIFFRGKPIIIWYSEKFAI